jgi:hypothetical protein
MAKREKSGRTAWAKSARKTRVASNAPRAMVARAAGSDGSQAARSSGGQNIRRMGPYETSYDVQLGYSGRDVI